MKIKFSGRNFIIAEGLTATRNMYDNQAPDYFVTRLCDYDVRDKNITTFLRKQIRQVMHIVDPIRWKQIRAMVLADWYKRLCYTKGTLLDVCIVEATYGSLIPLDNSKEYAATEFKEA